MPLKRGAITASQPVQAGWHSKSVKAWIGFGSCAWYIGSQARLVRAFAQMCHKLISAGINFLVKMCRDLSISNQDDFCRSSYGVFYWMAVYALIACLLGIGGNFTLRFAGVQIRALPHSVAMLWKKADQEGISPFQALTVGLSTRVGTGNIIGIAVALTLGGPGAIFWMWVTALLGMSIAFVESTLAQIFKVPHKDRTFRGGPAYYIRMGLNSR